MFNREFRVKKSSGAFILKGFFSLIMFLLSLCCCLFPKLYYMNSRYEMYIIVIGILGCAYFAFLFLMTVISGLKPTDALVLTDNGIYDFVTYPSKGLFIDWANISAVKIFGSQKSPLLGIELFDNEIFIGTIKKSVGNEIRANIETGLPAIVIKQSELASRLSYILPAFNDFISATRPIPLAKDKNDNAVRSEIKKAAQFTNNTKYPSDEELVVLPPDSRTAPFAEPEIKPIKNAKKDMDEIFILPPEPSYNEPVTFPGLHNKDRGKFPQPNTDEDPVIIAGTKNITIDSSEINSQITKEHPVIKPVLNIKSEPERQVQTKVTSKNADEIKTLDDLLSTFSVPVITETEKKNKNEKKEQ